MPPNVEDVLQHMVLDAIVAGSISEELERPLDGHRIILGPVTPTKGDANLVPNDISSRCRVLNRLKEMAI